MNLMKIIVLEILQNYDVHVIKGLKIELLPGLTLRVNHMLSVAITKRDSALCNLLQILNCTLKHNTLIKKHISSVKIPLYVFLMHEMMTLYLILCIH